LVLEGCELRQVKYLNNIVEQDHRFIKRRVKPGLGFFSSENMYFETKMSPLQSEPSSQLFRELEALRRGLSLLWAAK
jgi:transposase, IS6 family